MNGPSLGGVARAWGVLTGGSLRHAASPLHGPWISWNQVRGPAGARRFYEASTASSNREEALAVSELIDTTEMYLKTVYEMEEDGVLPLRARIVERLDHSGPTVSQTVARMERDGLIHVAEDRSLQLTEEGRAREALRNPRMSRKDHDCGGSRGLCDGRPSLVGDHTRRPSTPRFTREIKIR